MVFNFLDGGGVGCSFWLVKLLWARNGRANVVRCWEVSPHADMFLLSYCLVLWTDGAGYGRASRGLSILLTT